ncbi:MAG TPA: hypothetical protein VK083_02920 [Nocardia sp.]|uniref:hypothetical protein n=1 Tax=Nocardia sp. TaxID=1821 RepID=UPI002B4AE820|nr:hypothetical protein [Nocardia sp.]HLS75730.1 hypothetical protein [Nocardia sp.]
MTELYRGLDPTVAAVLAEWAEIHGRHYELDRWLVNGRSKQPVAVVRETELRTDATTVLVMKVLSARDSAPPNLEYARHRTAEVQAPDFAARHLSEFVHDAVPVPGQQWITFQRVAGKALENTEVLTVLLRRMLGLTEAVEPLSARPVTCSPEMFAEACGAIVSGVLGGWANRPFLPAGEKWDLATFFRRHLSDQLAPGGRLAGWADRHQGESLELEGEPRPLPNPFAVAAGKLFDAAVVSPVIGRCHGDLHTDNALIRVRPSVDVDEFYLIDTALYESKGPLTRDPAHLVLYIVARVMEAVSTPSQQSALIELLIDPVAGPAHLVPGWLAALIRRVDVAASDWVEDSGLGSVWREQACLSLAACALLFLGRTSTREIDKPWFLRLAARAVARFAEGRGLDFSAAGSADRGTVPEISGPAPAVRASRVTEPARSGVETVGSGGHTASPSATPGSKFMVNAEDVRGLQVGDGNRQENNFH